MTPNVTLLLQSLLIFFQMVNAALATGTAGVHVPPIVSMLLAAFVGAFQFYVTHVGNGIPPKT